MNEHRSTSGLQTYVRDHIHVSVHVHTHVYTRAHPVFLYTHVCILYFYKLKNNKW
jgi:hypothetical protein